MHNYFVRCGDAGTSFNIVVTAPRDVTLTISVLEEGTEKPLAGVEVKVGPYQGRTDTTGHADVRVAAGANPLVLWKPGYVAPEVVLQIDQNVQFDLHMLQLPDDHPDPGRLAAGYLDRGVVEQGAIFRTRPARPLNDPDPH